MQSIPHLLNELFGPQGARTGLWQVLRQLKQLLQGSLHGMQFFACPQTVIGGLEMPLELVGRRARRFALEESFHAPLAQLVPGL